MPWYLWDLRCVLMCSSSNWYPWHILSHYYYTFIVDTFTLEGNTPNIYFLTIHGALQYTENSNIVNKTNMIIRALAGLERRGAKKCLL